MEYNKNDITEALFDVIYSSDIPVEIKEATLDIVDCFPVEIDESYVSEEVNSFMEFLDSLVYSSASKELIEQLLDEVSYSLNEDFINEVSNEWVKRKVQNAMDARRSAVDKANRSVRGGVVGLTQVSNQDQAESHLKAGEKKASSIQARLDKRTNPSVEQNKPKAEGFMGKLKSAVGKVKQAFTNNKEESRDYAGLSRIIGDEANRRNIDAETLRQQTTHATPQASDNAEVKTSTSNAEATPVNRNERIKELRAKFNREDKTVDNSNKDENNDPYNNPVTKAYHRHENKVKKDEEKAKRAAKKAANNDMTAGLQRAFAKLRDPNNKNNGENNNNTGEPKPKRTRRIKVATSMAQGETPENTTPEDSKPVVVGKPRGRKPSGTKNSSGTGKPRGRKPSGTKNSSGTGKKTGKVNEALTDLAVLLAHTNISESCFTEIMEMTTENSTKKRKERFEQMAKDKLGYTK